MTPATPIIIVTKGRHEMLAMTLASLYTLLSPTRTRYDIYHVWQDTDNELPATPRSPYVDSYACRMAKAAITSLSGIGWTDSYDQRSVAACRAGAIKQALAYASSRSKGDLPENVIMFDGDVIFHGNPLKEVVKDNQGVTGWTHLDVNSDRGFADFDAGILRDTNDYLDKYGDLPHCEYPSPFHLYAAPQTMHHVSTQAAWRTAALTAKGTDGLSVLDVWTDWPKGVRCYDVAGCLRIAELGLPIKIIDCANFTLNMYLKPDAEEGNWVSDAVHPTKVV